MFSSRQRSWLVVDLGGRWIKCARYVVRGGSIERVGQQVIDIHEEGLLSMEEIGAAIRRLVHAAGDEPLALVLPQASAVSQVVDLPKLSAGYLSSDFDEEIRELTGLSSERCVYDCTGLEPFGGYVGPQWITVAKEETLGRSLAPFLGQALRVEAVTTGGNALVAAFRRTHPEVRDAYLVDVGATQTTLVELRRGDPIHMVSLVAGGETWVEAVAGNRGDTFEEVEGRLFAEDMFADPELGAALRLSVADWYGRLTRQIGEWREDLGASSKERGPDMPIYLVGGYARVVGLSSVLQEPEGVDCFAPEGATEAEAPEWLASLGAVSMASGLSELKASILPRSLKKVRQRRQRLEGLRLSALYIFIVLTLCMLWAIGRQAQRLDNLETASQRAQATLVEIEDSESLLKARDELALQIEPLVHGQLASVEALETFRRIQKVHRDFDFALVRFVDRRTYFLGLDDDKLERGEVNGNGTHAGDVTATRAARAHSFVVELRVPGDQAERLQTLGDVVGRLRNEDYFANVDRLVKDPSIIELVDEGAEAERTYALLLTLNEIAVKRLTAHAMAEARQEGGQR